MTIVAGGCSFVWGCELWDHQHGGLDGYSRVTFPAILTGEDQYVCAAYPGIGNKEIMTRTRKILDMFDSNVGAIINWTWPLRDDVVESDIEIIIIQRYLIERNIPYMFTCADNCMITGHPDIDYSRWFFFPPGQGANQTEKPRGFYQWAVENKYPCGPQSHPLEPAHADAAEMMKDTFNELVKKHLQ
jgi:hypothetical protein